MFAGIATLQLFAYASPQGPELAAWREDVRFVVRTLIEGHADAFHTTPRAELERLADAIEKDLALLSAAPDHR